MNSIKYMLGHPKQNTTPFFSALMNYAKRGVYPFHTPSHRGIFSAPGMEKLLTASGLACDLPSMTPLDSHLYPKGCFAEAQLLAAELWGAQQSFFLANGSTIGIQALMLSLLAEGDKVILPRQVHISTISGLILTGARPIYLPIRWIPEAGPIPPTTEDISEFLEEHPDAKAVILTNPTYYGIGRRLDEIAQICHQKKVPLLVDEAHGSHLRFLPDGYIPQAIDSGADAAVQSIHKTLGSLVGTSQILLSKSSLLDKERVQRALNLLQSTSSNYLLFASLDLTRHFMAKEAKKLFRQLIARGAYLRSKLNEIDDLHTLELSSNAELSNCMQDPLKLVIDVSQMGVSGYSCGRILFEEFGLYDEFCDDTNVVYILSHVDTEEVFYKLISAYQKLASKYKLKGDLKKEYLNCIPEPAVRLTPSEAFSLKLEKIPLTLSVGRICGETITLYPPGIPFLCPGELITDQIVELLLENKNKNKTILANDSKLQNITVIK